MGGAGGGRAGAGGGGRAGGRDRPFHSANMRSTHKNRVQRVNTLNPNAVLATQTSFRRLTVLVSINLIGGMKLWIGRLWR